MNVSFNRYVSVVVFLLLGMATVGYAQSAEPQITARFIPDSVAIGDRFKLEVEVERDIMQVVGFPEFDDNMLGGIVEILAQSDEDTIKHEGRRVRLRKVYDLTSFEDGYFGMGRFPMIYVDKNISDTIWSIDSLKLKVTTLPADTATRTIYDIKELKRAPFKLAEIAMYISWVLLGLLIIAIVWWIIYTRRKNLSLLGKPKIILPPHVIAIKELEELHSQKLWQKGELKPYYTRLTDILRKYISDRFEISAMEMTSDEIMAELDKKELSNKSFRELQDILKSADLVKFAKYTPSIEYNESAYNNAFYFVEETKPTEIEVAETLEQEE